MRPHNAIFAGVITRVAMKYVDANLLFRGFAWNFPNCTFRYVKQKLLQSQRSLQVRTRRYSLDQLPPRVPLYLIVCFMVFHH